MKKINLDAERIMHERFGKDSVLALATTYDAIPYVRYVNAYYENGHFYIITHALSNKMKQIANNPIVAIGGEWFQAHAKAYNLGYFGKAENQTLAQTLRSVFASWIDNGHNDFNDENTIILCLELTDGIIFSHGTCYVL